MTTQGTPDSVVRAMLDLARLRSGETFVDIGAGDGRVLLEAVLKYDAGRAVGVELDPAVHAIGLAHIKGVCVRERFECILILRVSSVSGREVDLRKACVAQRPGRPNTAGLHSAVI